MSAEDPRVKHLPICKWDGTSFCDVSDALVCEEPLEIQIEGRTWVTVMRTPGDDEALARGLLFGEGLIKTLDEIQSIRHCTVTPTPEAEDNILQIRLAKEVDFNWQGQERHLFANASCGVCGKASLENLRRDLNPLPIKWSIPMNTLTAMPATMRQAQSVFEQTGGLHAAALFNQQGQLLKVCEDIGRHNATDKVIGWGLITSIDFSQCVLVLSGRLSFEIAQKSWKAGVPILVAVSAASSLAVAVAHEANMGLISFTRDGTGNCSGALQRFEPHLKGA
jgi:FdhD protein